MAAEPIIYCLERLTDYDQFERLAHDLMSLEGYARIEPLGGRHDKGRDALHVSEDGGQATVFAYSVRKDWRDKLAEDAEKIQRHGHPCQRLVFVCTAAFSATERDEAVESIRSTYGWALDLYGLERLRVLLGTRHPGLVARHPQIFTPSVVAGGGTTGAGRGADQVFLDYAAEDEVLSLWLARRLTAEGYRVWCRALSLRGGDPIQRRTEEALRQLSFRAIAVLSHAALRDQEYRDRRGEAHDVGRERACEFLIPVLADDVTSDALERKTRELSPVRFHNSWAEGLRTLLARLESLGCPRPLTDGPARAVAAAQARPVVSASPEPLFSNAFPVVAGPEVIHRFNASREPSAGELAALRSRWAFHAASPTRFLSFHSPPAADGRGFSLALAGGICWRHTESMDGIACRNLVPELIRKSLEVQCRLRGLLWCDSTRLLYFPEGLCPNDRLRYRRPDGRPSRIGTAGRKKHWRPTGSTYYRYQLSPQFFVRGDLAEGHVVIVRVRVRLATDAGAPLDSRAAVSRRKHLCKGWWNDDWLHRILAIAQFLGGEDGFIRVGTAAEEVTVRTSPLQWDVSVRIDEDALGAEALDRDEVLADRSSDAEDEEEALPHDADA